MKSKIIIKMNDKLRWFTLVELIVVITILAILGTIGFVQMNGFSSNARDSRRVSDMSNITQAIELAVVTQGNAPIPTGAVSYTGGSVTLQMGTVTNTTLPRMSGDFSDPVTKAPYNYSVFGNGNYYQLGIDFENPLSYTIGIPGIETVYATDDSLKYSKLSGNYLFDPSLPSLFPIPATINTASGGIFSPDVCFVMNNVSTNTFSSTSTGCLVKKNMTLNNLDNSLVGYWDMESLTSSGLLKDLSGNGNDGVFSGTIVPTSTGGYIGKGYFFTKSDNRIYIPTFNDWTYTNHLMNGYTISAVVMKKTDWTTQWRIFGWFDAPLLLFDESEKPGVTNYTTLNTYSSLRSSNTVKSNEYVFIVGTYDWKTKKIYIDWVLQNYSEEIYSMKGRGTTSTVTIWWINHGQNIYSFPWTIDDIKIYSRALSDSEIKQHAKIAGF